MAQGPEQGMQDRHTSSATARQPSGDPAASHDGGMRKRRRARMRRTMARQTPAVRRMPARESKTEALLRSSDTSSAIYIISILFIIFSIAYYHRIGYHMKFALQIRRDTISPKCFALPGNFLAFKATR
jgi:hypothetical protein